MRGATEHIGAVEPVNRLRQLRWALASSMFAALAVALVNIKYFYKAADWRPLSLELMKLTVLGIVLRFAWVAKEDQSAVVRVGILTAIVSVATDMAFIQILLPH